MLWRVIVFLISGAAVSAGVFAQTPGQQSKPAPSATVPLTDPRRDYGQNVAPVYEGWEPNPDGTISLYFGYMNRNWKEEVDVQIGSNNFFEPGPQDRGQPTHFLPRRHKQIFSIVVPKDFPRDRTLTWTLNVRARLERVPASLKPEQQIDVSRETASGNQRPKIDVGRDLTASAGEPITITVSVTDDGVPKARGHAVNGDPPNVLAGPNVRWSKYRGPGNVKFTTRVVPIVNGKATTSVMFDARGEYLVQALADDGSMLGQSQGQSVPGFSCCWVTGNIRVTVR